MNRFAKKFRVLGSLCILVNLFALFLPVTRRVQENYADLTWSQADYIKGALGRYLTFFGVETTDVTSVSVGWVLLFMVLPLLLALIAGIWGLAGSSVQKVSSVLAFAVLLLYAGMAADLGRLWPEAASGQEYCRGAACVWTLAFSGCGAFLAVLSLLSVPGKVKAPAGGIPQIEEIRQEQAETKYNIIAEEKQEPQQEHGVLVGRTGLYAGAEIPLPEGEYIRLGRQPDNHLVFEGQRNVSRRHCQIKWDAGRQKYMFRDYSSNGSFVNGREDCLPQNLELELEPGSTIAIGDENNTFYLK